MNILFKNMHIIKQTSILPWHLYDQCRYHLFFLCSQYITNKFEMDNTKLKRYETFKNFNVNADITIFSNYKSIGNINCD